MPFDWEQSGQGALSKSDSTEEKAVRNNVAAHFLEHHGDVFYVVSSDTLPVCC